jgi:hypothetical protein
MQPLHFAGKTLKTLLLWLIQAYQLLVSPLLGPRCRFYPTCSAYALTAIERFGIVYGSWLAVRRVVRCHPFHPGGYDPVPEASHTCQHGSHGESQHSEDTKNTPNLLRNIKKTLKIEN